MMVKAKAQAEADLYLPSDNSQEARGRGRGASQLQADSHGLSTTRQQVQEAFYLDRCQTIHQTGHVDIAI